jgi:DivIVA domain-containing protein
MAEGERRQRVISSTPRLLPEEVANRAFGSSFRGYSETEVRSYLRRVAEELTSVREREQELLDTLDDLEEQLRAPKPLDEKQLLDMLGEETSRLLRTAREASEDIRRKAEERSSSVMEEAQAEAHRLRTDATEILGVRTQEAEAVAAEIIGEAEARGADIRATNDRVAQEQMQRAEQEAESIVEHARHQGREMLDEARVARERVLADLGRRRGLLQAQVEELRQGRDRLLEAYRVVKRTFLDATEALAQVEARAASERAHAVDSGEHAALRDDTQGLALESEAVAIAGEALVAGEPAAGATSDADTEPEAGRPEPGSAEMADVDSLFARIRAGHTEVAAATEADTMLPSRPDAEGSEPPHVPESGEIEAEEVAIVEVVEVEEIDVVSSDGTGTGSGSEEAAEPPGPEGHTDEAGGTGDAADAWRARHAETVNPLVPPLVKRAKRSAQDDQNSLLDAVRRHKGRPSAQQVLRDDDALVAAWSEVLRSALDDAYRAGREAAGAAPEPAPDEVLAEAAATIAFPLRDRIAAAIDDVDAGDTSGLVERIGARYREWKNQQLERALCDVMVMAWSRGVYDGADVGTVLRWIPLSEGRCADCDDNALEPTVKGETFPTGQSRPPAHPGCRCLLAPAEALAELSSR